MKLSAKGIGVRHILHRILQPGQGLEAKEQRLGELMRQGLAIMLSALIIIVPMGQGTAFAQAAPNNGQMQPQASDNGQATQAQALGPDQLDQLVAPIALYPDALVAQVLAGATYPAQVTDADRWRQAQGNAPPEQIAAGANAHDWDPSVKALTAFPTVLAEMDKNLQWTTDLGNAYFNQPQDVMDAVQAMRQKALAAGQLRSTPQETVATDNGAIVIAPANPTVVYVPAYNPWTVYGGAVAAYPGFYYAPPPDVDWGAGLAIGFGVGIGVAAFASADWGWGHWGCGWHDHSVVYNHNTYISHSRTVVDRGGRGGRDGRGTFAGGRGGRGGEVGRGGRGGDIGRGGRGGGTFAGGRGGGTFAGGRGGRGGDVGGPGSRGRTVAGGRGGWGGDVGGRGGHSSGSMAGHSGSTGHSGSLPGRSGSSTTTARSSGHPSGGTSRTMAGHSNPRGGHSTMARGGGHPSGGTSHTMAGHSNPGGGHSTMARSSGGGHASGGGGHPSGGGGHPSGGSGGHKK